jgi:glucan phosphoethanolaminetransferase (alkaline phosphatase superfamily)
MGLLGATTYIYNTRTPKLGDFFILLFAFGALAIAGSFYHDFLWCGTVTNWYTERVEGNYDFDLWLQIVHLTNRDYQLLGISQATLAIFLIIFTAILIWRYNFFSDNKLNWQKTVLICILSFFIIVFFGFFLFIIDIGWYFDLNVTFHSLYFGFFLISLLFYYLGKVFIHDSNNELKKNDKNLGAK